MIPVSVPQRPLIFSGEMVRAILDERKTMTRRVIKPQPKHIEWFAHQSGWCARLGKNERLTRGADYTMVTCPYGQPGDQLWVRESLTLWPGHAEYTADQSGESWVPESMELYRFLDTYKRATVPPIHMPRWASRLTLEITEVKVERLKEISEEDAIAEGCPMPTQSGGMHPWPRNQFRTLWDTLNGKKPGCSWDSNPWVWCIRFRPLSRFRGE